MLIIKQVELRTFRDSNGRIDQVEANVREGDDVTAAGRVWISEDDGLWRMLRFDATKGTGGRPTPQMEPTTSLDTAIGGMIMLLTGITPPENDR